MSDDVLEEAAQENIGGQTDEEEMITRAPRWPGEGSFRLKRRIPGNLGYRRSFSSLHRGIKYYSAGAES